MKYEEPKMISYEEAIEIFSKESSEKIADAIISLALHDQNRLIVENWCLFWCNSNELEIRAASVVAIGHLARIHGKITKEVILPALKLLEKEQGLQGVVSDALDDIEVYCK